MPEQLQINRGILIFVCAWFIIPVMDGGAKFLNEAGYPMLMVVWGRFAFNLALMVPIAAVVRRNIFAPPPQMTVQIVRAVALVGATLLFYLGLSTMALADALAAYFIYPLFVTALAPLFLGEIPGLRRWVAVGVGFAGSLLVIQPGSGQMNEGIPYVIVAAACFAVYNLLTKKLSGQGDAWQTLAFQMLVGSIVMCPVLLLHWKPVDPQAIGVFSLMAVASAIGHYLIIRAYDYAPASVLAPFSYFEIVSATVIGFVLFGDFPSAMTWTGVAVIVSSGIYISIRERRRGLGQE
jgi:drug/metabolite transporter (DMT)-like permease